MDIGNIELHNDVHLIGDDDDRDDRQYRYEKQSILRSKSSRKLGAIWIQRYESCYGGDGDCRGEWRL